MIDLYTWATPNGRKISIMLEETGLPYRAIPVDIGAGAQHDPAFVEISPNGKIPAIVDTAAGLSLMESGAILIYLADKAGQLLAPRGDARYRTIEWLMMQVGSIGPMLGQVHHFHFYHAGVSDYAEQRYLNEGRRLYGVLERRLGRQAWLAGTDYSIADIATWPWIARFERHAIDWTDYPNLKRWYLEIAGRPAVARGYAVPSAAEPVPLPP